MIVVGVDPHKKTHTAVAVNKATAEVLGDTKVTADDRGHVALLDWARALGDDVEFAVEDCRHVSGRLQRALLDAGQVVVRVAPKLMAGARRSTRERGKSDPIDAKAVALAAVREPNLPRARLIEDDLDIKLLLDHREDLVAERSRVQQRLRWHLHELDLESDIPAGALDRGVWLRRVGGRLARQEQTTRVIVARRQLRRIGEITREVRELDATIAGRVKASHPTLLAIPGCGPLTAAKIVTEVAGVDRFANDAQLAMHAGVAPLSCSSGNRDRHRLSRSGNRQLNLALHRIAITQGRIHEPAKLFLKKKEAEGKSRREALRCLKRHLVRTVYNNLRDPIAAMGLT